MEDNRGILMRGKDIDAMIDDIKKMRQDGTLIDKSLIKQLYIQETDAQSDYDRAKDLEYTYENGKILDKKTGKPAPPDVVKAIDERVKLLHGNQATVGNDIIKKLQGLTELRRG